MNLPPMPLSLLFLVIPIAALFPIVVPCIKSPSGPLQCVSVSVVWVRILMTDILYPWRGAGGSLSLECADVCVREIFSELFCKT